MQDNCINVSNWDQKDSDNNGIGDLCEDKDNDEILYWVDNCKWTYNPFQKDLDNDWIGDRCDEKDDRILESNSWILMWIIGTISLLFIVAIVYMMNALKKNQYAHLDEKNMTYTQRKKHKQKDKKKLK